jgi:Flp pilus assembly pilin Flp
LDGLVFFRDRGYNPRKQNKGKESLMSKKHRLDESGMGTVEIILIIVVLITLVIIFRNQIIDFVNSIFENITGTAETFDPAK